jgi:uroporphyrinogen-III synthase
LQTVLDALPGAMRFLRITGHERVELRLPPQVSMIERVAYGSVALPLDPVAQVLREGNAIALLHSAATAAHFAAECDRLGIARGRVALAGLGPRITAAAGTGWRAVHIPPLPNDSELLALVRKLCL